MVLNLCRTGVLASVPAFLMVSEAFSDTGISIGTTLLETEVDSEIQLPIY